MRLLPLHASCLFAVTLLAGFCAASDDVGIISGTVRDLESKPVAGAKVTLTCDLPPLISMHTISSGEGQYRFSGLRPCRFRLIAEKSGFVAPASAVAEVSVASSSVEVDFKLGPMPSTVESKPPAGSHPPPKFEAAGVRGLIDSGGYSAAANGAAASGLIEGIADIKRADNGVGASAANQWPCGLEPELRTAVAANPSQGAANRRLGEFYIAHNQAGKAVPFFQRARQIDPSDYLAARDLAFAWMKSGQFATARELLETLPENQRTPETHRLLARAYEGSGMFRQASQQYQLAANSEPSEENLFGVGYELILAGLPADAAGAFTAGLTRYPQSITLLIGSGTAEFLQGHTSEGLSFFLRASDLYSSDPRPYSFIASASKASPSESERVRSSLKRFLDLAPNNAKACYFYALSLLNGPDSGAGDTVSVESLLKRAIALDPGLAGAHLQLGVLYERRGDFDSAAHEFEAAILLAPELKEAHYRLAGVYRHTGRVELAAREMQLYQQARAQETSQPADSAIGIEQFVSVFDRPVPQMAGAAQCPEATP